MLEISSAILDYAVELHLVEANAIPNHIDVGPSDDAMADAGGPMTLNHSTIACSPAVICRVDDYQLALAERAVMPRAERSVCDEGWTSRRPNRGYCW